MENFSQSAEWTTRYKNDLPDSAFLYIEAGGKKDSEGKIKPRSLRHFPYKNMDGKVDRAHILNAIARIPQALFLSQAQKDRLQAKARGIYLKFVKYNSKKANSFTLFLNKLAAAVNLQPSRVKMDRWYEDPNFYAAENMNPDAIIENVSTIIRGSKCLQKCLASETFAGMGTWEETLRGFVWSRWVSLEEDHNSELNDPMIGSVVHMQTLQWLRSLCPNCFG